MDELRVKLPFTPGVKAKVQHTSRIPIGAKVEISLKSLLGVKTEIGKK
jgi:predicted thioesterase